MRTTKMTQIEHIEQSMTRDQIKLMEEIWDNIRWSKYSTYDNVHRRMVYAIADLARKLVLEPAECAETVTHCREAGAALLWLEEMMAQTKRTT